MIVRPVLLGSRHGQAQAVTVPLLHAVNAALALGRHERGVEDDGADPAAEGGDDAGNNKAARGMGHQRDGPAAAPVSMSAATDATSLSTVSVARSAGRPAAGQVDDERRPVEVAAARRSQKRAGGAATVNEDDGHRTDRFPRGTAWRRSISGADGSPASTAGRRH